MAEGIIVGVAGGLIVAAILWVLGWLRKEENRGAVEASGLPARLVQPNGRKPPGDPVILVPTPFSEECRKCGKTR